MEEERCTAVTTDVRKEEGNSRNGEKGEVHEKGREK